MLERERECVYVWVWVCVYVWVCASDSELHKVKKFFSRAAFALLTAFLRSGQWKEKKMISSKLCECVKLFKWLRYLFALSFSLATSASKTSSHFTQHSNIFSFLKCNILLLLHIKHNFWKEGKTSLNLKPGQKVIFCVFNLLCERETS